MTNERQVINLYFAEYRCSHYRPEMTKKILWRKKLFTGKSIWI